MKKFMMVTGATIAMSMLAGCDKENQSDTTSNKAAVPSLKIGLINQEKEQVSYPELSAAAKAAVKYINEKMGGVAGRPLELEVCAAGDSAESAVGCANRFVNRPDIPFVINSTYNTAAVSSVLLNKKAIFTFNASLADATTPNLYTLDPGIIVPTQVMIDAALRDKVKSVSVLITDDPETKQAILPLLEMIAKKSGVSITHVVPVGGSVDMTTAVTAAQAESVDGLITVLTNADQCIPVGQALTALDIKKPIYSAETCAKTQIIESGAVNGWTFTISSDGALSEKTPGPDTLRFREIIGNYSEGTPDFGGTAGYAVAQIMAIRDLYELVGVDKITPDALNNALRAGWKAKPLTTPSVSCPGSAPFIGQCQNSMYLAKATEGSLSLLNSDAVTVDMSAFSSIVE